VYLGCYLFRECLDSDQNQTFRGLWRLFNGSREISIFFLMCGAQAKIGVDIALIHRLNVI
jgi:hypothetical protein